jgi:hypothetical protein
MEILMLMPFRIAGLLAVLTPLAAVADGFEMFARLDELKKTVIVEAGDAELLPTPFGSLGKKETVKVANYCFEPTGYISGWSYGKRAALVLVDEQKNIKLALLEDSIGSVKVSTTGVVQVNCP